MRHRLVRRMDMEPGRVPLYRQKFECADRAARRFHLMSAVGSTDKLARAGTVPAKPQGILVCRRPSDVGCGYPELFSSKPSQSYAGIWRKLVRMDGAGGDAKGIRIDEERYTSVLSRAPACTSPWLEEQHISLKKGWWALDFVPKQVWDSQLKKRKW